MRSMFVAAPPPTVVEQLAPVVVGGVVINTESTLPPATLEHIKRAATLLAQRHPPGRFPRIRLAYHRVMGRCMGAIGMAHRAARHERKRVVLASRLRKSCD